MAFPEAKTKFPGFLLCWKGKKNPDIKGLIPPYVWAVIDETNTIFHFRAWYPPERLTIECDDKMLPSHCHCWGAPRKLTPELVFYTKMVMKKAKKNLALVKTIITKWRAKAAK